MVTTRCQEEVKLSRSESLAIGPATAKMLSPKYSDTVLVPVRFGLLRAASTIQVTQVSG